ncbi:DUF1700 domain-containing protein [Cohnella sp. REN36]|uniref:DUF1700 domain-containing protein n=1 Tax=Cohnella sp. REN36 TaxID=2887347 RepID=UPI001D14E2E6|nr:DUF1700 domain-containing protein [Cohnella sp. REN36]MCC3375126.1 DUF1700 domain-containing protein [Cohnella sp. REN36]
MNKNQYLDTLSRYLEPMPGADRERMLNDIEAYFLSGEQIGKSEAQIAAELGDPMHVAAQTLGFASPPAPPPAPPQRDPARIFGVTILLFFLNVVMLPIGAALWSVLLGVAAATLGLLLSPGVVVLGWLNNAHIPPVGLFATLVAIGIGLLLMVATYYASKLWIWLTAEYLRWNVNLWRGRTYA